MKNEEDVLVDVPRRACNVEAIVPHVRHAVDSTKKSLYRGCQFVTTTPTSRYIVAVLTEATHFAMERVSKTISSLQTAEESEWTYADDVVSGERWLTLDWYERQLVDSKDDGEGSRRPDALADFSADQASSIDDPEEEAGYHVARLAVVSPARWQLSDKCAACGQKFCASRHRHHCRLCGRSVCRVHGSHYRPLPALAAHLGTREHRVCDECDANMEALATAERAAWRVSRAKILLREISQQGGHGYELPPYFDVPVDTATNKARRLLRAAAAVARTCPLLAPASATITVEVLEILCKYGPAGLATLVLRREFVEAAELLRRVARVDAAWPLSAHELTAAIYYLLALRRGARGSDPDAEKRQLSSYPPCDDETLYDLRAAVPAALWCYLESPTAVELVARQQGYALLFENGWGRQHNKAVAQPGFICVASRETGRGRKKKKAILAIRGTASVHDVATDVRAFPAPFPPQQESLFDDATSSSAGQTDAWTSVSSTFAFAGMARAAQWMYEETASALMALAAGGFELVLTGHSLGAGVASLFAVMLRNGLDERGLQNVRLRCFGFATPACVDKALAEKTVGLITSVVLHDDVVPRLTARSLRSLMTELLRQRETCMRHWRDDLDAVWGRLRNGLWAPRWRDSLLRENSANALLRTTSATTATDPPLVPRNMPKGTVQEQHISDDESSFQLSQEMKDSATSIANGNDEPKDIESTVLKQSEPLSAEAGIQTEAFDEPETNDALRSSHLEVLLDLEDGVDRENSSLLHEAKVHSYLSEQNRIQERERIRRVALSAAALAGVAIKSSVDVADSCDERLDGANEDEASSSSYDSEAFEECNTDTPLQDEIDVAELQRIRVVSDNLCEGGTQSLEAMRQRRLYDRQSESGADLGYTSDVSLRIEARKTKALDENITVTDRVAASPELLLSFESPPDQLYSHEQYPHASIVTVLESPEVANAPAPAINSPTLTGAGNLSSTSNGLDATLASTEAVDDENSFFTRLDEEDEGPSTFLQKSTRRDEAKESSSSLDHHMTQPSSYLGGGMSSPDDGDEARFFAEDFDDVDKLPELFVPGRVVHIYSWRGTYDAALVDRACPGLADIVVSANMISDHSIQTYFDAIAEVITVRRAPDAPPAWQPFHATDSCQCCGAKFTWHVTSNSETQTYREKHNCRSCGLLVCDPCSKRRRPLPRIGLLEQSRVCDRCHYQGFSNNPGEDVDAPVTSDAAQ